MPYISHHHFLVGCVLILILIPTLKLSNFYGADFLCTYLVYKKYFIDPSAKIVDDHDIRRPRTARQMYYWSSKCPFYLALLLGCLPMCLLCRSGRSKATNNAAKQGTYTKIDFLYTFESGLRIRVIGKSMFNTKCAAF